MNNLLERALDELSEFGRAKISNNEWNDFIGLGVEEDLRSWAKEEGVALKFDCSKPDVYISLRKQV